MDATYTAVIQRDGPWWIGWIEEIPGVNSQGSTREELLENLRSALKEVKVPATFPPPAPSLRSASSSFFATRLAKTVDSYLGFVLKKACNSYQDLARSG